MHRSDNPFDPDIAVDIYWNLRRRCWSVRQRGLVVGHTTHMLLRDVVWRVQASGRERVRREGKKNVHAYARGTIVPNGHFLLDGREVAVRYNPYELTTFMAAHTPLHRSESALFAAVCAASPQPRTWVRGVNY